MIVLVSLACPEPADNFILVDFNISTPLNCKRIQLNLMSMRWDIAERKNEKMRNRGRVVFTNP